MKIIRFVLASLLLSNIAIAQTEPAAKANMVVKQPSVAITRAPRGGKMGEVYINSPVTIEKEEGEWVLVSLKAWMKKDGLSTSAAAAPTPNTGKASDVLLIETFSTRMVEQGLPEKRLYLTLKLKNNSATPIESWRGILVAQANSAVVFREALSDDSKTIAPGQTIELNFYWEPSEQPFQYLKDASPESMKLEFYQVVVEKNDAN